MILEKNLKSNLIKFLGGLKDVLMGNKKIDNCSDEQLSSIFYNLLYMHNYGDQNFIMEVSDLGFIVDENSYIKVLPYSYIIEHPYQDNKEYLPLLYCRYRSVVLGNGSDIAISILKDGEACVFNDVDSLGTLEENDTILILDDSTTTLLFFDMINNLGLDKDNLKGKYEFVFMNADYDETYTFSNQQYFEVEFK